MTTRRQSSAGQREDPSEASKTSPKPQSKVLTFEAKRRLHTVGYQGQPPGLFPGAGYAASGERGDSTIITSPPAIELERARRELGPHTGLDPVVSPCHARDGGDQDMVGFSFEVSH
jgi:hypothetical protein